MGPLTLEEIWVSPGQEWSDAVPAWRFLRLHSGAAYWLGAPQARSLTEGEMLVIPPQGNAVIRASQINEAVLQSFCFAPEMLAEIFSVEATSLLALCGGAEHPQTQFLPTSHAATQRFAALIAKGARSGPCQRAEVLSIAAEVFDGPLSQCQQGLPTGASAQKRFAQVIAQMPDAELVHHTAAELARLCGCSPRHFNRLFRRQFGASIRVRQTELRLVKARQLLGSTQQPIQEIARECGYRNLSLFNSLFRRRFGMTPSECRELRTAPPPPTALSGPLSNRSDLSHLSDLSGPSSPSEPDEPHPVLFDKGLNKGLDTAMGQIQRLP